MISRLYQIDEIPVPAPIEFKYQRKIEDRRFREIRITLEKRWRASIYFSLRMTRLMLLKELNLSDFTPVTEPGIEIGENMPAVASRHFVKRLAASLGQNDGIGGLYRHKVIRPGLTTGAEQILIGFKARVVGQNHQ
jgi:hypothetical protein